MNLGELIEEARKIGDSFTSWYHIDANVESLSLVNDSVLVKLKQEQFSEEEIGAKFKEFSDSDEFRSMDTPYFYFSAGYRKAMEGTR